MKHHWIRITIGILIYLFLLMMSISYIPLFLILKMLPPIVVAIYLVRNTLMWVKYILAGWLLVAGLYLLYNNTIMGPMSFAISDRPIDVPSQFFHSWRLFWVISYLEGLSWLWGLPIILFLAVYKAFVRIGKNRKRTQGRGKVADA